MSVVECLYHKTGHFNHHKLKGKSLDLYGHFNHHKLKGKSLDLYGKSLDLH